MWPECKTANPETEDIEWVMKWFSSETIALIKDTDKEDKEKALKQSWETAEPGRAEKAKKSREKFLAQQKFARGEELTQEEHDLMNEKRERVKKKDLEEIVLDKKGQPAKGGKAPAKPDPKAKAKAQQEEKPVQEDESKNRVLPMPESHVNTSIVEYLSHFKRDRVIDVPCTDPDKLGHKRSDSEKVRIAAEIKEKREEQKHSHEKDVQEMKALQESREQFKSKVFGLVEDSRSSYKTKLQENMTERNKYRDMIASRKDKERILNEILAQEKIDIGALQTAIDAAVTNKVDERVILRGRDKLQWLTYCKEIEAQLVQAVAEKVKDNILAVLERIEKEGI